MSREAVAAISTPLPAVPATITTEELANGPLSIRVEFKRPLDQWHQDTVGNADMTQDGPQAVTFTIPAVIGHDQVSERITGRLDDWEQIIEDVYRSRLVRAALNDRQ